MVAPAASRRKKISLARWCIILLPLLASINWIILPMEAAKPGPANKQAIQPFEQPQQYSNPDLDSSVSPQSTSCDQLFSAKENIGSYCQCKDADPDIGSFDSSQEGATVAAASSFDSPWRINQLNCYPQNFTQIIDDLSNYLALNSSAQIQIDYFSINTNLTQAEQQLPLGGQLRLNPQRHLLIDHISLQLEVGVLGYGKTIDSRAKSRSVEEQMIDFFRSINETHLQFLSIFLEDSSSNSNNKYEQINPGNGNGTGRVYNDIRNEIKFGRLLAMLTSLSRLELSLGQKGASSLLLESETLKELGKLRWLNLASNAQIKFDRNIVKRSPFTYSPNLEYLSLESSNLDSFALFTLFAVPLNKEPLGGSAARSTLHYYGLPNLISLNLAGNKLASIEGDLFTQISSNEPHTVPTISACYNEKYDSNNKQVGLLYLPALTQLDLSHNQLRDINFKSGQYILCSMPNLNQLYLQHNKINHLNLNSLLTYPIGMPNSLKEPNKPSTNYQLYDVLGPSTMSSQLEHIDLSHNHLVKITAIQWVGNTTALKTRVKSINLSYNKLQHPVALLDPNLINKLIFKESFDFIGLPQTDILSLNNFDSVLALDSTDVSAITSICDFLSPNSSKLPVNSDLLNEILLANNELSNIGSNYFSSKQCKDVQILRLSKNRIESIASNALFELRSLEQLELSNNLINYLKEETFSKNIRLRILDLSYNRLSSIKKNSFLHLTELESLSLSDNQLFELPIELFAHNNQLEIIDLSNNKIGNLNDLLLYNLKYLRILNLSGNQLRKLSYQIFELLPSGSSISYGSRIGSLVNSQFSTSLKQVAVSKRFGSSKPQKFSKKRHNRQIIESANVLVLTSNLIDSIEFEKCVQFGQNIQLLWLVNNRLKDLNDGSFKCFRSIQKLYLNSNRIRFIGDFTFHHLTQLEYLDLSKNYLSQLQANSLAFPNALSYLDLSNNRLNNFRFVENLSITKDSNNSRELIHFEYINIGENPDLTLDISDLITFINRIELHQFHLGNIERIKLTSTEDANITLQGDKHLFQTLNLSSINYLHDSLFTVLSEPTVSIERIDLSFTDISLKINHKLAKFLINKLHGELIELNIGGNQYGNDDIARLFGDLKSPIQLQTLNISSNILDHWPLNVNAARELVKLRFLDLSRNKLRHFIKDEIDNYVFHDLEILNLSSNSLMSLVDHPKYRIISLNNLMPSIRQLDLSHNRLSWIPLQFLDNLSELKWLRLDNNQFESLSPIYANQRLILDLSFNHKLRTINGGGNEIDFQMEKLDFNDLIIYDDNTDWLQQLKCQSIDDYLESHKEERVETTTVRSALFVEWDALKDDERVDNDRCPNFIQMIDSIRLDSISALINLNAIKSKANKYLHINLRRNGLNRVEKSDRNNDIVKLDLGENKIQDLPDTLCKNLIELRSLDLSYNQIDKVPYEMISYCTMLNYLDLSHNKIISMKTTNSIATKSSALLVLKLNNNMLKDLAKLDFSIFRLLRFLDLRFNQLKSNSYIAELKHSHMLTTIPRVEQAHNYTTKLYLKLSDTSLIIDGPSSKFDFQWHTISIHKIGPNGEDNNSIVYHPRSARHVISFCTLNLYIDLMKVCLEPRSDEVEICFFLKIPKNISPCLTNLHEPESANVIDQISTITNSSLLSAKGGENSLDIREEVDPVLSFIDSLKKNWLKLKEFGAYEYLASIINVKVDSIWTTSDGKYAIHTLTLVKLSIVGGSICIVVLLIAMFALLTCRTTNGKNLSPKNNSESTNVLNTDTDITDSSITNSGGGNDVTSQIHKISSPSIPCSSARSKSTSDNDDTQNNTVLERRNYHQLEPNQLMLQHQQQACSTPSSSLAPSSVETAETLQAVDSIKSATSVQLAGGDSIKRSVDQYAEGSISTNNLHPQYPVATVMRIVKSSSTDFNPSSRVSSNQYKQTYGTLNNRHSNYPTLKTKLRSIYESQHQKHQIHPVSSIQSQSIQGSQYDKEKQNSCSYITNSYMLDTNNNSLEPTQDPTTRSLLSINSGLSTSHNVTPSVSQQFSQDSLQSSNNQGLCHYHRLVHDSNESSNIILEQQEEEQYNNNELVMMNNLPPPPSSRVIEALENSIYYMTDNLPGPHFSNN